MRPNSVLITKIRQASDNSNYSDLSGIQDNEIVEHMNDAQSNVFSKLMKTYTHIFLSEVEVVVSGGQEAVTIPASAYLGYRIVKVEYRSSGNSEYAILKKGSLSERFNTPGGVPGFYISLDKQILLQPSPTSAGTVRFTYQRRIPRLDIARGTISAVTLLNSAITALTIDPTTLTEDNIAELLAEGYITIVDYDGAVQMVRIPITAINSVTGVTTVRPGFLFQAGETITVGDTVVAGQNSTTVSQLPDDAERYLRAYTIWKLLKRDSNTDSVEQTQELIEMSDDIVSSFAMVSMDVEYPTILDSQFLDSEW